MTALLERIEARRPKPPTLLTERMSPFMRKLAEKNLPTKDLTNGAWTPSNSGGAA